MATGIYRRTKKNQAKRIEAIRLAYKTNGEQIGDKISKSLKKIGVGKWNVGRKLSMEVRNKMSATHKLHPVEGDSRWNWKGDEVGYSALHAWVRRVLGSPTSCTDCGKKNLKGKQIHWANKSGEYKRNIEDWIRLCRKCHSEYDLKRGQWGNNPYIFT